MDQKPEFLFLIASSAVVLGVIIAIRGLLMFRAPAPAAAPAADLPEGSAVPVSDGETPTTAPVRDLKEPMFLTLAGIILAVLSTAALQALINS